MRLGHRGSTTEEDRPDNWLAAGSRASRSRTTWSRRETSTQLLAEASEAGATIVKEAQKIFLGRHGFFADPDGFLWEVAWKSSLPMAPDGSIELPD